MDYLFRGKRVDNGEWVEGNLINWGDGTFSISFISKHSTIFSVLPETVGMFTGLKGFEGDIVEVCIYLVSPENVDNDQHYRGVITFEDGSFKLKIFQYLTFTEKKSKWIPLQARHLPFYDAELDEYGTYTTPYYDFVAMSGNLGEFDEDNVEIVGNLTDNPELLKEGK